MSESDAHVGGFCWLSENVAVAKMGSAGAVAVTREGAWLCDPFRVRVVDSTAAGDAFTAALGTALGEGMALPQALRFANAAGALAVTGMGAQSAMPERRQVEELMQSQETSCTTL